MEESFELAKDIFRFMEDTIAYKYASTKVSNRLANLCDSYKNTIRNIQLQTPLTDELELSYLGKLIDKLDDLQEYCSIKEFNEV